VSLAGTAARALDRRRGRSDRRRASLARRRAGRSGTAPCWRNGALVGTEARLGGAEARWPERRRVWRVRWCARADRRRAWLTPWRAARNERARWHSRSRPRSRVLEPATDRQLTGSFAPRSCDGRSEKTPTPRAPSKLPVSRRSAAGPEPRDADTTGSPNDVATHSPSRLRRYRKRSPEMLLRNLRAERNPNK